MSYYLRMQYHEEAAAREQRVAATSAARNEETAYLHARLAELHQREARRYAAVGEVLKIAFGT